jgi:two-component system OmpR family response regulator
MRVLLVDTSHDVRENIGSALTKSGFIVSATSDGEEGWFLGDTEELAAIVVGMSLPKLNGVALIKQWRRANRSIPIFLLNPGNAIGRRLEGFDAGADDCLDKPYDLDDLIARLRAVVRRYAGHSSARMPLGRLVLDHAQMKVTVYGAQLDLSPLEYRLIAYLGTNQGRVISSSILMEHIYPASEEIDANTLAVLVGRIRRKVGEDLIETRRGFGYIIPRKPPEPPLAVAVESPKTVSEFVSKVT